jgi:hypothetical protein
MHISVDCLENSAPCHPSIHHPSIHYSFIHSQVSVDHTTRSLVWYCRLVALLCSSTLYLYVCLRVVVKLFMFGAQVTCYPSICATVLWINIHWNQCA